ncbi:hypothetical protein [Pseudofrankia sp. BMG5.36]|uniref:hypothetical protein n=1 Tax=Pseudofrankia sp. BMG5.36 TaxID=1834512 RepID=UPI0012FFBA3F|nr:hypothetical protein [Pseudofrankia sp. BMG5.36]
MDPVGIRDRLADRPQLAPEPVPVDGQKAGDSGEPAVRRSTRVRNGAIAFMDALGRWVSLRTPTEEFAGT